MRLDPLAAAEIDRFLDCISNGKLTLAGPARDLAANPLLLTLSVIVGHPRIGEADATELFDRGIDVLLGQAGQHRRFLAEIAFRAAVAKGTPAGEFTLSDLALPADKAAVDEALALPVPDRDKAWTTALSLDERSAITSAEAESHLLTTVGGGWRYFHDRALAFLAADRVATCALAGDAPEDEVFGMLGRHLADPFWADVVEATGRLLELRSGRQDRPEPPDAA